MFGRIMALWMVCCLSVSSAKAQFNTVSNNACRKQVAPSLSPARKQVAPSPSPVRKQVAPSPAPARKQVAPSPSPGRKQVAPSPSPARKQVAPSPSPARKQVAPRRSHPAQSGETFDGPPSLERSGSERRGGAVTSLSSEERGLG